MMNLQYINARWVLGWALVKHVLRAPFVRRDPSAWVARIRLDRLGATPEVAWQHLAGSSRCLGCGLCDAVVPPHVPASAWLQGVIRQPEDATLARAAAAELRAAAPAIRAVCPAGVDAADTAALIEAHAAVLEGPARLGGKVAAPPVAAPVPPLPPRRP